MLLYTTPQFQQCGILEHPSGIHNLKSSHFLNDFPLLPISLTFLFFDIENYSYIVLYPSSSSDLSINTVLENSKDLSLWKSSKSFITQKKSSFYKRNTCFQDYSLYHRLLKKPNLNLEDEQCLFLGYILTGPEGP